MNNIYIIDRIEGNYVVTEDEKGKISNIPIEKIKGNFKECDILVKESDYFRIDKELTEERKKEIEHITKNMWN